MKKARFFTEERVAGIFRWWMAAAVYFFIGWGTGLGNQNSVIDFVFFLGVTIGIAEMFVISPVIRAMLNTREGFYWRQKSLRQKVGIRLMVFLRSFVIVCFIVLTYNVINMGAIRLGGLDPRTVFLPGEPIMFGIFYIIYFTLITGFTRRLGETVQKEQ